MSVEIHNCQIVSSFVKGTYVAICDCDWEGTDQETLEDAQEEWDNHCDVAFMKATER